MPTRFYIRLPEPALARGPDATLAFSRDSAQGMAEELEQALRSSDLFDRWKASQPDPDDVDAGLAEIDPLATVKGEQADLHVDLVVVTSLPGAVFKHRLRLLAGSHWQLRDVTAA